MYRAFKLHILLFIVYSSEANAQFTTGSATVVASGVSNVYVARYTGNDILSDGSDTYRVSCWDHGSSATGISWWVNYSTTTYNSSATFTSSNTTSPSDVCLIKDGGNIYVVATYHNGTDYYWEVFEWQNGASGWGLYTIKNNSFETASYGNTLHIDGDESGTFVIIWDDLGYNVYVETGTVANLNNSGAKVRISNDGFVPDAASYYEAHNKVIHACYIKNSNGHLIVDDHTLSNLSGGINSPTNVEDKTQAMGYSYGYPRIACPNSFGDYRDWTVVVDESDVLNGDYRIVGSNNNAGTTNARVYNAGPPGPTTGIRVVPNYFPVVTYDNQYPTDGIWVGWTMDNTSGTAMGSPTMDAVYPLVLKCDNVGVPVAVGGFKTYWDVPNASSLFSQDSIAFLSLSGRHATDLLFLSYYVAYDNSSSALHDINSKEVQASAATSLRSAVNLDSGQLLGETKSSLFDNFEVTNDPVSLKLYDLKGNIVIEAKGTYKDILEVIKRFIENSPSSVYLERIIADDGRFAVSHKIFTGN